MRGRIQVGDFVKIKNHTGLYGEVEDVSERFTTIKLVDEKGISKGHLKLEDFHERKLNINIRKKVKVLMNEYSG